MFPNGYYISLPYLRTKSIARLVPLLCLGMRRLFTAQETDNEEDETCEDRKAREVAKEATHGGLHQDGVQQTAEDGSDGNIQFPPKPHWIT